MRPDQGHRVADEEKRYYSLVKRAFGTLAPVYDIFVTPMSGLRDRVVRFADVKPGSRILDVGTGTGKQAFAFAKLGYEVVGVDLSDAMLRVASRKNTYKNATFSVADATNLPFPDAGFDVACTSFVIHTMPLTIREKALKEMVRVTRRGGTVLIVDFALPRNRVHRLLVYSLIIWSV
jgi:ubiquinone/menaquinone biosynthesis C-methylase UbiE